MAIETQKDITRDFFSLQQKLLDNLKVNTESQKLISRLSARNLDTLLKTETVESNRLGLLKANFLMFEKLGENAEYRLSVAMRAKKVEQITIDYLQQEVKSLNDMKNSSKGFLSIIEKSSKSIDDTIERIPFISANMKEKLNKDIKDISANYILELAKVGNSIEQNLINMPLKSKIIFAAIGFMIYKAWKYFKDWDDAAQSFINNMGIGKRQMAEFEKTALSTSLDLKKFGVSMDTVLKVTSSLIDEFGSLEAGKWIETASIISAGFSLSAESAAKLVNLQATSFNMSKRQIESNAIAIKKTSIAFGVSAQAVMEDIAKESERVSLFWKDSGKNIATAAVFARKLGMNISDMLNTAEALLDIESSTQKAMQAQIMLDVNININEARRLAMHGNLYDMQKNILDQMYEQVDVENLHHFELKSLSNLLGVSADKARQMLVQYKKYRQDFEKLPETMQRFVELGEKSKSFSDALGLPDMLSDLNKLGKMLGSTFAPFLRGLTASLSFIIKYLGIGVTFVSGLISKFQSLGVVSKAFVEWVVPAFILMNLTIFRSFGLFSNLFSIIGRGIRSAITGTAGLIGKLTGLDTVMNKLAPKLSGGLFAPGEKRRVGRPRHRGILENIFGKASPAQILSGAAALLIISGAVWVFSKALQNLVGIKWKQVAMAGVALVGLTTTLIALGLLMSSGIGAVALLAGAGALLLISGAVWTLGKSMGSLSSSLESLTDLTDRFIPLTSSIKTFFTDLSDLDYSNMAKKLKTIAEPLKEIADSSERIKALKAIGIEAKNTLTTTVNNIMSGKYNNNQPAMMQSSMGNITIVPADVVLDGKKIGKIIFKTYRGD